MAGNTNFPTGLDDNTSLFDVTDGTSTLVAGHHNNIKEAVKAIEEKLGIRSTVAPTSLDYRLGNPTGAHAHDGASGSAQKLDPTTIMVPSGGHPSGLSLYDHLMSQALHTATAIGATGIATALGANVILVPSAAILVATGVASVVSQSAATALIHVPSGPAFAATGIASVVSQTAGTVILSVPTVVPRFIAQMFMQGSAVVGTNKMIPLILGRTLQLESISGVFRVGPSGATTAFDISVGPTSFYEASQLFRPIFAPGATAYRSSATPNLITYPSGAIITADVDAVGSNDPGQDLHLAFVFRE